MTARIVKSNDPEPNDRCDASDPGTVAGLDVELVFEEVVVVPEDLVGADVILPSGDPVVEVLVTLLPLVELEEVVGMRELLATDVDDTEEVDDTEGDGSEIETTSLADFVGCCEVVENTGGVVNSF